MRVYTNSQLRNLINLGTLTLGLIVLIVLLMQAFKVWSHDSSLQEIRQLIQPEEVE